MRAAAVALLLFAASGCAADHCKQGTLFLSYTLAGGAEAADTLDVTLAVAGAEAQTRSVVRPNRGTSGSIVVDFVTYPTGQSLALTLSARSGNDVLASSSTTTTASPGCSAVSLALSGSQSPPDLSTATGASADLAAADLSTPPDLTTPADMVFIPGPSCSGLASTCGPSGTDSCCNSPVVPAATFKRSYDVAADAIYSDQTYGATLSAFRLDKYEITVGRFRKFVNAGRGTQSIPPGVGAGANPYLAGTGWDTTYNASLTANTAALVAAIKCTGTTWTDAVGANENLPMNCITWFEAFAFCAWDGGFMPTEAEWNLAASGGTEQRAYAWSNPPGSVTIDNTYAAYGLSAPPLVGSVSPKGDGRFGQSDMPGSVFEWTLDWFANPYSVNPCTNCANLTMPSVSPGRVIRGGAFSSSSSGDLRSAIRQYVPASTRGNYLGSRCAKAN